MWSEAKGLVDCEGVSSALVLEDEPRVARALARILRNFGIGEVLLAASSSEALALFVEHRIELMLVDIKLGRGKPDGVHFLRAMRDRGYQGLAVMVSGDTTREQFFRAAWAGANDFIVKNANGMDTLIKRALTRRNDHTELEWRHLAVLDLTYLYSWRLTRGEIWLLER